ncbi:agamous-like MADS-box protein TM6 [Humulus lupulus]|uniref:agamous-like MADS-box protein TM6 n=1 Tax=Humulus lupulus TaxID=3486 RepID=UPI002B417723|nr:agamous-like MADS-box protein TM6 [Humulus lupulus]
MMSSDYKCEPIHNNSNTNAEETQYHHPHRHLHHRAEEEEEEEDHDQSNKQQKIGRGKTQIKFIENQTNRQVTFSKRRNGIFKKAGELSVLCDAKVSLIIVPNNNKLHEYITPGANTKDMLDLYQRTKGVDLWKSQYEAMQQTLRQLKAKNFELRTQIRQRLGYDLNDLSFHELSDLENSMLASVEAIRHRKNHKIKTQAETTKKRNKSWEERNSVLVHEIHARCEDPPYGLVEDNEGAGYESAIALATGASNLYAFRHHQNSHSALHSGGAGGGSLITTSHSALHSGAGGGGGGGGGYDSFDLRNLRLA